jgi:hypothetical protein
MCSKSQGNASANENKATWLFFWAKKVFLSFQAAVYVRLVGGCILSCLASD